MVSVKGGKLYTCFADFQKAFDSVIRVGIKFKLLKMDIRSKFYNIVKDMYSKSRSCIKIKEGLTNSINLNPFYLDIVKSKLLFWHRDEIMPSDSLLNNGPEIFKICGYKVMLLVQ